MDSICLVSYHRYFYFLKINQIGVGKLLKHVCSNLLIIELSLL